MEKEERRLGRGKGLRLLCIKRRAFVDILGFSMRRSLPNVCIWHGGEDFSHCKSQAFPPITVRGRGDEYVLFIHGHVVSA